MERFYAILVFTTLLAPLVAFAGVCAVRKAYPGTIAIVSLTLMTASLISALILISGLWNKGPLLIELHWFAIGSITFDADLAVSNRSMLMLLVVAIISLLVHLYSTVYMKGDEDWKRYFAMLGFFTFSMQGIVLTDNLLFLFIFWELVGFSSYMLIGHWTRKPEAGRAASKAFIMNRIGDAGFLIGIMIIWTTYETFSLTTMLQSPPTATGWHTAAALCIFCGIIGKSAQFPLFTWLPDAMEGPTPVSALIHAATMVAAGVYLLVRVFALFTSDALVVVAITGMITTLAGALAALSQFDIKKTLAYSTMSQLGLMILALGMGVADAALLHLLTHAFFKACLFLAAGSIIHSIHAAQPPHLHFDAQDIRNMGGLRKRMPVTFFAFLLSGASLAGVPFFSGFLSKEAIVTTLFMHTNMFSWLMLVVVMSVSFLTALYTFRLVWLVFFGEERVVRSLELSEGNWRMRLPLVLLALGSLWFTVSLNPFSFSGWLVQPEAPSAHSIWITSFSIVWVLGAAFLGWYIFRRGAARTNPVLMNAFFVDRFYAMFFGHGIHLASDAVTQIETRGIDRGVHAFAYAQVIFAHMIAWIDRTFIDGTVNAFARLTGIGGKITRSFQGGNIQLYIFWSVLAIIIFIIWAVK